MNESLKIYINYCTLNSNFSLFVQCTPKSSYAMGKKLPVHLTTAKNEWKKQNGPSNVLHCKAGYIITIISIITKN